jgi:hypothetical protein
MCFSAAGRRRNQLKGRSLFFNAWEHPSVLQTLWNYFSPFTVLKDVDRGTVDEKAAAYRHNYEMRSCLLGYMRRWLWTGTFALLLTMFFDSQSPHDGALHVFDILAAAPALFATVAVCGVMILGYAYVFLSCNEVPAIERRSPARLDR